MFPGEKYSGKLWMWYLVLLLCFNCCSTNHTNDNIRSEEIEELKIELDNTTATRASHIFNKPEFVALETNNECLFSYIDQLIVSNKYIIVLEGEPARRVLIFSREGKYLTSLGKIGSGPNEFQGARGIALNERENEITYVEIAGRSKLVTSTFNGRILAAREHNKTGIAGGGYGIIKDFKTGNYIITLDRIGDYDKQKYDLTKLCVYDDKNGVMHTAILNTLGFFGATVADYNELYRYNGDIYFAPRNWDTIYAIKNYQALPRYILDFGSYTQPNNLLTAKSLDEYVTIRQSKSNYVVDHLFLREFSNYFLAIFRIKDRGSLLYIKDKNHQGSSAIDKFANDWIGENQYSPLSLDDVPLTSLPDTIILTHDPLTIKRNLRKLSDKINPEQFRKFEIANHELIRLAEEIKESDNPIIGFYPIKKNILSTSNK